MGNVARSALRFQHLAKYALLSNLILGAMSNVFHKASVTVFKPVGPRPIQTGALRAVRTYAGASTTI